MGWGLLLAGALGLYLFDNGTGPRLLLAAAVALPLCSALALWLVRPALCAEFRLPEQIGRGEAAEGTILLKNKSKWPAARVTCRVELLHRPTGERTAAGFVCGMGPGGRLRAALTLSAAHSGRVEVRAAGARLLDAFGLFARNLPWEGEASVLVLPDLRPVEGEPEETALSDSQDYSAGRAGTDPGETFQIRAYVPGDPIRQIHWKLSQKTGRLLVRELGLPVAPRLEPAPEEEPDQGIGGLTCIVEPEPERRRPVLLWRMGLAGLLYTALWGGLCGTAGVGGPETLALLPGAALAATVPLLPSKWRRGVLGAVLALAALWCLLQGQAVLDGGKLMLHGLFAASEARQAYVYERFAVSAPEGSWAACVGAALLPLGLALGGLCGWSLGRGRRWPAVALFLALAAGWAYLGVIPGTGWCVLLSACLGLAFLDAPRRVWKGLALGALAAVCAVVLLAFPGEDPKLSAWEAGARDALAVHTTVRAPQPEERPEGQESQIPEAPASYENEDTLVDFGGSLLAWAKPASAALILLLLAALLFGPSIASDRLKKRRARNRKGLDDPDNAAAIRAAFLHALRWLKLGGVPLANVPFSQYAHRIGEAVSPALQARFEEVLPLWQEAAYSAHAMDAGQREAMLAFLEEARRMVWERLGIRGRVRANYIDAL